MWSKWFEQSRKKLSFDRLLIVFYKQGSSHKFWRKSKQPMSFIFIIKNFAHSNLFKFIFIFFYDNILEKFLTFIS